MVVINAPLQQDKIIDELKNYNKDGVSFRFIEKKAMKLYFETSLEDQEQAARLARQAIKDTPWGSVMYFQATAE